MKYEKYNVDGATGAINAVAPRGQKICKNDPSRICPRKITVTKAGTLRSCPDGIKSCCTYKRRAAEIDVLMSQLEPNKNYNGTIYTESVINRAKMRVARRLQQKKKRKK
jgi:hypothetical protein